MLLDPHYKAHQGDANDEAQVKALMRYLDGQRAKHEFALMIPTHGRKPPNTGAGRLTVHDIAAGSGAIVRGAEIILAVEITKPGVTNLYAFKHRDGDDELPVHGDPWTLSFSRESGYQRVDTTTGERKASAEEIAAWIHEQGGRATPGEIKDRFDIADATLRDRRPKLAELGIDYTGTGKNAVYVANHPAPRTPRLLRGQAIAGSEPDETKGFHPAPRDPALETAAGSGNRSEQGFSTTPHPAPPKGGSPTTAGSGQPSTTTIDADTSDGFTRASGVVR